MEEPVAEVNAGHDDYMTMDADTWLEQDDTYENGDTLGLDLEGKEDSRGCKSGHDSPSRGERIKELKKERVVTKRPPENTTNPNTPRPTIQPLPNRYITIRRPPMNANRRPGVKHSQQYVLLKCTTVCLVLLSFLLTGGLIGLSYYYVRLSGDSLRMRDRTDILLVENYKLKEIIETLRHLSKSLYHISTTSENNCSSGKDLFILNPDLLEEQMKSNTSFKLNTKIPENGSCGISYLCTIT